MSWEHFGAWKGNSWLSCVSLFGCVKIFHYLVLILFILSSELFLLQGKLWLGIMDISSMFKQGKLSVSRDQAIACLDTEQ